MDRERADKWCAKGVLGLVLAILIFSPLALGAVEPACFVVVQWLTVALILVWGIRFWINPKHRLLWSPVSWAVFAFVVYAVARYAWADVEYVARQELVRIVVYAVLFYAIVTNLHRQDATQWVSMALIVLATLIAMYAVVQFLTESDRVWWFNRPFAYHKRGSGTFICPNHLAGYLEMILPLALAYTFTGRFEHVAKIFIGYCFLLIFSGIAVSVSRGGWLATCLTLMVLFFWLLRQRDYRLQASVLLVILAVVTTVFFAKAQFSHDRQTQLLLALQLEDLRFLLWEPAVRMWQDHIWWGVGPAHFDCRFREYRPGHDQLQVRPDRVHNDYLNTLVDWGLVGTILMVAIWVIFFWEVFRSWKYVQRAPNDLTTKRSNKTSLVLGASLGLLAILIHSFLDFNMHIPANALVAVTLMALVVGHFRFATEKHWATLHFPLRSVVAVVLSAALVFLSQQGIKRSLESYWLAQAKSAPDFSTEQIKALEKALAAEPQNPETAYELGEVFRTQSWQGGDHYQALAEAAMKWFQRSSQLNPYNAYAPLRYGMCLDWLNRHTEAEAYFKQAQKLDPNGFYTLALIGWHYVQRAEASDQPGQKMENYRAAQKFVLESLRLNWTNNPLARSYHDIINRRLAELGQAAKS